MTNGEKMVWAAVFAKEFDLSKCGCDAEKESTMVHQAIEEAAGAVYYMRKERDSIIEGFGESSDVTVLLNEIMGNQGPPARTPVPEPGDLFIRPQEDGRAVYEFNGHSNRWVLIGR